MKLLYASLIQAIVATLGSLYFSEVMGFNPCKLCWIQRIFMYPLVFIFLTSVLNKDSNVHRYALPLSVAGWMYALYHNIIYYKIIEIPYTGCTADSCTLVQLDLLNFISIPLLSLVAFTVINVLMFIYWKKYSNRGLL